MKKLMVSVLSGILLVGVSTQAFAWETERKLDKKERYEMRRIFNDERDGRMSPRQANYLEHNVQDVRAEENYLKHHGELSHGRERQLDRDLRYDNRAIDRAEDRDRW
jgi:hypothetical protein